MMRLVILTVLVLFTTLAQAVADTPPPLPETLQNLAAKGAQVRYLGREKGLDGWLVIQGGQEQFFYVTPDREAILMGVLFDKSGKMLTVRQVQNLQQGNDPTLESLVTDVAPPNEADALETLQKELQKKQEKSPSQKLYEFVESANFITLGANKAAPYVYAFLDPQCPHCHQLMTDLRRDYLDTGRLQVRMIPVGLKEETKAQAAFLLAAPDPQAAWYKHLDGDKAALPVSSQINLQAAEQNLAVMQDWKLDATPTLIYKSASGEIKIIRGRPKNLADLMTDLY